MKLRYFLIGVVGLGVVLNAWAFGTRWYRDDTPQFLKSFTITHGDKVIEYYIKPMGD